MGNYESLSVEETNKLRISIGLKPIELPERNKAEPAVQPKDADEVENKLNHDKTASIDPKISRLRSNLQRAKSKSQVNTVLDGVTDDDSVDWIANVKLKKRPGRSTTLNKDYFEEKEEPEDPETSRKNENGSRTRVTGQISELVPGKDVILTLKESELGEEEIEDTLVNEGLAHDQEQANNMRLKRMNQDRKRRKITIGKGSMKEDDDENQEEAEIYLVNGRIVGQAPDEQPPTQRRDDKRVDVASISDNAEESAEEASDFAAVKIKKRKKLNNSGVSSRRSRPTDFVAPKVALIDEDSVDPAEDELQNLLKVRKKTNLRSHNESLKTPEQIAKEVELEKKERASRVQNLNYLRGITIDENSAFLSSLKGDQPADQTSVSEHSSSFQPVNLKVTAVEPPHQLKQEDQENTSGVEEIQEQVSGASFEGGLAATLGFLRNRNVIPAQPSGDAVANSISSRTADLVAYQQQQEAQNVRSRFANELAKGSVRYSKEELESLQKLQEQEINDRNKTLQRQRLAAYNPEVNLTYKDNAGNVLTTKEAYKKLSQAFHGTRSNSKKLAKARQKVQDRNRHSDSYV
ncbi:U4/U6-U5 snRNP complex subunit SNU66 LALA0_S05e02542g [Lachancea lanzarotensis]|uniref:LALA0S05e02542g1_1 n=1 Tax=Lachancea lanzarotensis TaxID=1245769 RepID=A0A0C7MQV5_9SACH|nr:uncharacterized protein LALA0_S05e02542g [Lachancea lanzarotensis]CEP62303.1 LALA0S05e02542g1_1 [Lachancea lanzarotensis]